MEPQEQVEQPFYNALFLLCVNKIKQKGTVHTYVLLHLSKKEKKSNTWEHSHL